MKILYIANVRLPTEKAHGIQIVKMCEAFANLGHEVKIIIPWRFNHIKTDPFEYYAVRQNFKIIKTFSFDLVWLGKVGFWIQSFSFAVMVFCRTLFKKTGIIYSRDELPLFFLCFFKKNLIWETHTDRFNFIVKYLLKKCSGVVSITEGLKNFYTKSEAGRGKILVAPDGVDLKEFTVSESKNQCRERFSLPQEKNIIMYSGHLYYWKGPNVLLGAAEVFKQTVGDDCLFVFIGGTKKDVEKFIIKTEEMKLRNILILGHMPHVDIPFYLKAADILVLPNSGKNEVSAKYTSPLKLFEYMASGIPIVASSLSSIREVLNESNALLVKPDDSQDLANGIMKILRDKELSDKIAKKAMEDVREYTWEKRAEKIISFIKHWNKK